MQLSLVTLVAMGSETAVNDYKHLGVASCASGVCHGKSAQSKDRPAPSGLCTPKKEQDVALREYLVWQQCDRHSAAYNRLKEAPAQRIAEKLGLANAWGAKICLDCHSDTAPGDKAGPKFRRTDGVGCEACHGGSEKWIEVHKDPKTSHAENVRLGMYPSDQPLQRAQLCLSCHLGTKDKYATHVILGAGHPRLSFELEAFTANQPKHYVVDADYVARKGTIAGMNLWVTGQLENAERYLTLLQSPLLTASGMVPELAFYDCFGCHHPTDSMRWSRERAGPGVNPGTLRLQKQNLLMLQALAAVVAPAGAAELAAATDQLVRAGQVDPGTLRGAAQQMLERLRTYDVWSTRVYSQVEVANVRKTLVRFAADDKTSDFAAAEQVVLGVESLSHTLNDYERRTAALDALYDKVKSGANFNPAQFADTAKRVLSQF
jgi:Cytochrome c554 and c-prime